jgi:hypothetical protein
MYYDYAQDYYKFTIPNLNPQGSESIPTETPATPMTTASVMNLGKYFSNEMNEMHLKLLSFMACL